MPAFDTDLTTIDGQKQRLSDYAGRALLVVNLASRCGFTPQYEGLEALYRRYAPRGFVVLGFPCNQFGAQEPGDAAEIKSFCSSRYDVTFPVFAKTEVNGPGAHPLYRHLTEEARGIFGTRKVKWNFTKFLVAPDGQVVKRYAPSAKPASLTGAIEALLPGG
jgi:glutathione peroxidase